MNETFRVVPAVVRFGTFEEFAAQMNLGERDLIVSDQCVLTEGRRKILPCPVICQDDFGAGEPTVERIAAVAEEAARISGGEGRIIGIGGGSALDIAKAVSLAHDPERLSAAVEAFFAGEIRPGRKRGLILVPTTCGTGSEVTNVSVAFSGKTGTKAGIAADAMFADTAALVPELLDSLPPKVLMTSSIDALIHAAESYLSPKATRFSRIFSEAALVSILTEYRKIRTSGAGSADRGELLLAACQAGIAFSNAGCGLIHAMSYPIGGKFHLPHGEANHQLFTAVLKHYRAVDRDRPESPLGKLVSLFARTLGSADGFGAFTALIEEVMERTPMRMFGMTEADCADFADTVAHTQKRLTANAYISVGTEEMRHIYEEIL